MTGVALSIHIASADEIFKNPISAVTNPNLSNPFTGGQTVNPNITVTGIGRGTGITGANATDRYNASAWTTAATLDANDYFTFTLDANPGFEIDFTSFVYTSQISATWTTAGTAQFAFRSSLDGFTSNIGTPATLGATIDLSGASFQNISGPIEFRLYAFGSNATASTFSVNDFTFNGSIAAVGGNNVSIGGGTTFAPASFGGAAFAAADTAVFDGVAGAINLSGAVVAAGLNFTSNGYTLAGTSGNTVSTPSIAVATSSTATISGQITGANALSKSGGGELILSGANNFVGNVNASSGVLTISSDANLGNVANDIALGGTLKVLGSVALNAGRDITGAGGLNVASGQTLTVNGNVNAGLTLAGSGTVSLAGSSTLTSLSFAEAGTLVTTSGSATLTGNISSTHTSGTAKIVGVLDSGTASVTRTVTIADGSSDVDLELAANLVSGTSGVRFHKLGDGTVRVSGDNSGLLGGFRLGNAAAVSTNGGRLIVTGSNSLGKSQFQFNYGTLEAETPIVFGIGASFGGLDGAPSTIQGANVTFSGSSSLFATSGQKNRIDVTNTTTLAGTFSGSAIPLWIGGSGTLKVDATASALTAPTTVLNTATLVINNSWGSTVLVDVNATLKGSGTIAGLVEVYGNHAVGNSVGTQTVNAGASYLNGSTFEWELTGNSDTGPGTNFDQLIVAGGNLSIESGAMIQLVFNMSSAVDWSDSFWNTTHEWTVADITGGGSLTGDLWTIVSNYLDAQGDLLSTVRPGSLFTISGDNDGVVLTYTAIPEPTTCAMLIGGLGVVGLVSRRRKRTA